MLDLLGVVELHGNTHWLEGASAAPPTAAVCQSGGCFQKVFAEVTDLSNLKVAGDTGACREQRSKPCGQDSDCTAAEGGQCVQNDGNFPNTIGVFFGVEGAWGSKNIIHFRNFRLGKRSGLQ